MPAIRLVTSAATDFETASTTSAFLKFFRLLTRGKLGSTTDYVRNIFKYAQGHVEELTVDYFLGY